MNYWKDIHNNGKMFDCVRLSEKFCIQMILLVQLQLVVKICGMWLERQLK